MGDVNNSALNTTAPSEGSQLQIVSAASSSTQQRPRQAPTFTVGNFEIGQTIGMGTFGKVKLGIHKITNEKVAVKVLDKDKLVDSADKKRLQREIAILRKIRHPHIIQLYEIIETPRQLFLFMEYAPNGELFDYIVKRTRLPERQASKFLQQIISGVEYMSKIGVVHRDLKPENLLLDHNFNIKIVDFGLSNTYKDASDKLTTACGSPCYAAPEMVAGKPYNGLMTDIWSSGVILYAMLCGYLPFEDSSTTELYKKIMHVDPAMPAFLTKPSRSIITGILAKDPTRRLNIEEIRQHPFTKERESIAEGIIVGQNEIPIDEAVLKQLSNYTIESSQAEDMIKRNKHNSTTSTYYLLLSKFIRNGGKSIADMSNHFRTARSGHSLTSAAATGAVDKPTRQQISHSQPPPINNNRSAATTQIFSPTSKIDGGTTGSGTAGNREITPSVIDQQLFPLRGEALLLSSIDAAGVISKKRRERPRLKLKNCSPIDSANQSAIVSTTSAFGATVSKKYYPEQNQTRRSAAAAAADSHSSRSQFPQQQPPLTTRNPTIVLVKQRAYLADINDVSIINLTPANQLSQRKQPPQPQQ